MHQYTCYQKTVIKSHIAEGQQEFHMEILQKWQQ